jgi:hypothetical protein
MLFIFNFEDCPDFTVISIEEFRYVSIVRYLLRFQAEKVLHFYIAAVFDNCVLA